MPHPSLKLLSNYDLLDQYSAMVAWDHYDPTNRDRPSAFNLEDLKRELRYRLETKSPDHEREA